MASRSVSGSVRSIFQRGLVTSGLSVVTSVFTVVPCVSESVTPTQSSLPYLHTLAPKLSQLNLHFLPTSPVNAETTFSAITPPHPRFAFSPHIAGHSIKPAFYPHIAGRP